ncbi:MAG TPA: AsmA family protein [Bryobacteraceae bacterium]
MRRIVITVCVIVGIIIILLLALPSILNVNKYRPQIQAELQKKLNRPVTLGELSLRIIPFSIGVNGITIGEAPQFPSSRPFATADKVYASASLLSLLRGAPKLKDVTLDNPQIELIKNAQGVWNYSTIGQSGNAPANAPAQPQPTQPQPQPAGGGEQFTLNELKIADGQVAVTNQMTRQPRSVYKHIDLTVSDFAPNKPFHTDIALQVPGQGTEKVAFSGNVGPLPSGNAAATPITGKLSFQQVSLAGINTLVPGTVPPQTDAIATGDANVNTMNETLSVKGNLKLDNAVVRGRKVDFPITANYDLSDNRKQDVLQINSTTVQLGSTPVSINGTVNNSTTPSNLNLHLSTTNASLAQLSQIAGAFSETAQGLKGTGTLSLNLAATGPADPSKLAEAITGTGTLAANMIQAQNIVLSNVHTNANFNKGVIQLAPLTSDLFGGKEDGTLTLDMRPATPVCSINGKLAGVDTNALLSAVSSVKNTLYGALQATTNIHFGLGPGDTMTRTLNGTLGFDVANGHLKNVNILNEISKVAKFVGAAPSQKGPGTDLKKLSGTFNIQNGVAATNNLVAVLPEGSLSGDGSLNLVNNGINMHVNAVLASGTSKAVGGTGIGGYLNTALANNQGELVVPVIVTGSMDHPTFMPDVQAITKMKLHHLLPTTGDPGKLATGVLGSALGNKAGGVGGIIGGALGGGGNAQQGNAQGNQKQQPQQNGLGGLLDKFGKKKPK